MCVVRSRLITICFGKMGVKVTDVYSNGYPDCSADRCDFCKPSGEGRKSNFSWKK